jgi:hypothetical protein
MDITSKLTHALRIVFVLAFWIAFSMLAMTGCSGRILDKSADHPSVAEHVPLDRIYQRTLRYDCYNNVLSDEWETISSPVADVEIHPDDRYDLYSSDFMNVQTGSRPSTSGLTSFRIDYAPGLFNMRVVEGINEIRYWFYYCDLTYVNAEGHTDCTHTPELKETGSIFIRVTYEEIRDEQIREIRPSYQSCHPDNP